MKSWFDKSPESTCAVDGTFPIDTFIITSCLVVEYIATSYKTTSIHSVNRYTGRKPFSPRRFHSSWRLISRALCLMTSDISCDNLLRNITDNAATNNLMKRYTELDLEFKACYTANRVYLMICACTGCCYALLWPHHRSWKMYIIHWSIFFGAASCALGPIIPSKISWKMWVQFSAFKPYTKTKARKNAGRALFCLWCPVWQLHSQCS